MILWRNLILGIAIFILTIFVGIYGINTFYGPAPEYEDYCPPGPYNNPVECTRVNGTWINSTVDSSVPGKPILQGYCDYYTYCSKKFEKVEEPYYKGIFLIAIPLGIMIIAVGLLIFSLEAVGLGLMAGGIGIMIYGAGQYWRFADDVVKFTLSLIGLVAVIILAYYFNKKFNLKLFGKKEKKEGD